MEAALAGIAAELLAEAVETGMPLAPLPPEASPATMAEGQGIAALVLERLGLVACGLRLAAAPPEGELVPGPVLEGRLLPDGAGIALATLGHPCAAPAVLGVLADQLQSEDTTPPRFATLRPALDIAAWRLREPPGAPPLAAADLAGLGLLVVGRGGRMREPAPSCRLGFGPAGARRSRGVEVDLAEALHLAARHARAAGGLPEGAVLVAPLGPAMAPQPGMEISARLAGIGQVRARFL